jgi:fibronectin-binding autotransporter adhesin
MKLYGGFYVVCCVVSSPAAAQLWDGGGANNNWTTANNWNPNGVPVNDGTADVAFGGLVRLAPVVNGAVNVRSITFASGAGAFDVNPGAFRFPLLIGSGGVNNRDSSTQTISNPILLSAPQTWRATTGDLVFGAVDGQGNALTINGGFDTTISRYTGTASSLVKSGSGTLFLTGTATSDGGITINAGTVSIDADARLGNNDVVINGGELALTADITASRNITLAGAGAALSGATRQLQYDAGTLTVNAGVASTASGFLGAGLPSAGSATIHGAGSTWTMAGSFSVGYQDHGTLLVQAGGDVSSGTSQIGSLPGSTGVATVTGAGSTWTCNGFLGVGYSGTGTLNIADGGSVSADSSFVGTEPGSNGQVNINGGIWSVTGSPVIGEHGVGRMTISGGGTVTDSAAFIGRYGDGDGAVTVTGAGSIWTNNGELTVANSGTGSLTVENGGLVTSTGGCLLGGNAGADGAVAVSGATFNSGYLTVGFAGMGTLDIGPGGTVNSAGGAIAGFPTANGSAVTVGGADARWTLTGDLLVGDGGAGSLTVENGGSVSGRLATVGRLVNGHGTAVVTGAGSTWTSDNLAVGYLSGTGSLSVQNGGRVTSQNGSVGNSSATGTATISGPGSAWDIPGAFSIGFDGTGTLLLDQGGRMSTGFLFLGYGVGSNAAATITGASSRWDIGFEIQMCSSGANATLDILGGTVTVGGDITSGGAGVSTLILDGGTLDMQNHAIGPGTPVDVVRFRSGTLRNVAGINNSGSGLLKTGPGTLNLNTANTYTGLTDIIAGVLQVSNATGSATGPGNVRTATGATLSGTGRITGAVQNDGSVAPGGVGGGVGASAGTLRLAGAYTQNAGGSLNVEIGGIAAGSQYDRLAVTGAAALNGVVNVTLINGFQPAVGDTFDILTTGARNGVFAAANFPPLNSGTWRIEYLPTAVRLRIACAADFNGDGFIDFFDFDDFVLAFEAGDPSADFNNDGFIDFFDFDDFVLAFDAGC